MAATKNKFKKKASVDWPQPCTATFGTWSSIYRTRPTESSTLSNKCQVQIVTIKESKAFTIVEHNTVQYIHKMMMFRHSFHFENFALFINSYSLLNTQQSITN